MKWDDLKIFLAVARHSKLSHASNMLRIDESTVSRRINSFETDLDITLFERRRNGHRLTTQGQNILEFAEQAEQAIGKINELTTGQKQSSSGTVRMSVAEGYGAKIMAPLIARFKQKHPDIHIELISGSGFLSLSRREADIAIALSKTKSKRILSKPLTSYKLHLYGSADYLNTHPPITTRKDLDAHTLISYIDDLIYAPELGYFEEVLPNATSTLRSTSILAQSELVAQGAGLAILPDFLARDIFIPVLKKQIVVERTFWLKTHKDIAQIPRIKLLMAFLEENAP